jgi:hypothetical protein
MNRSLDERLRLLEQQPASPEVVCAALKRHRISGELPADPRLREVCQSIEAARQATEGDP